MLIFVDFHLVDTSANMAPSRSSKADVIALGEHLEAKVGSIRPRQGATGGVGRPGPGARPVPGAEPVTAAAGAAGAAGRQRRPESWHLTDPTYSTPMTSAISWKTCADVLMQLSPWWTCLARKFCITGLNTVSITFLDFQGIWPLLATVLACILSPVWQNRTIRCGYISTQGRDKIPEDGRNLKRVFGAKVCQSC